MDRLTFLAGLLIIALLLLISDLAKAYSHGVINGTLRPGDTGNGCGGCHGASPGVVEVELRGSSTMLPGTTARYEVVIRNITHAAALAGFTSAIDKNPGMQPVFSNVPGEPTAIADSATQIVNNNSQFPLKAPQNGTAIHLVDLTMPASVPYGETFTIYTVGEAGWQATQVGWNHAPNFTVTVAPPNPATLSADQNNATTSLIPLQWTDSGQGEHFRILAHIGGYPEGPTDSEATLIYQGPDTSTNATGLTAGKAYHFAVWGKAPDAEIYSADAARTLAATIPKSPDSLSIAPESGLAIQLAWIGNSDEYRLLRRSDGCPSAPDDASAMLIYQGQAETTTDTVADIDTRYCYRVWGKVSGLGVFSEDAAEAEWIKRVFTDRFEGP